MTPSVKRRPYDATRRAIGAQRTQEAILAAARETFEVRGWAATIAEIATAASVSPKTVEAAFGTKSVLLRSVVDYAIRGDALDTPIVQREAAHRIAEAPNAAVMLARLAEMSSRINASSAAIAWVVESAAAADSGVAELWARMTRNLQSGVRWAAATAAGKPGLRKALTVVDLERTFLVGMTWSTYRTLDLSRDEFQAWLHAYYARMLLARSPRS